MANSNGWGDGAANNAIGWGQGANNNIGWGDSHAKSWAGATDIVGLTTDADAQAFITAAAITDATQQSAIDTLVKGLKTDGVWTKMKAIYPFVGGTASTHKWNLKDPRDLDAAFRLVFNGGWTHSSNGATPNGTNGVANTYFNPSLHNINNSSHISNYSRTLFVDASAATEIGCLAAGGTQRNLINASFAGTTYCLPNNNTETVVNFLSNGVGFYLASRTSATAIIGQRNSTQYTGSATTTRLNQVMGIGAAGLSGSWAFYSPRQTAFSSIGDGLTDTEASNLYTRVQTYQTALSRQV
jgi:hypothetical protein